MLITSYFPLLHVLATCGGDITPIILSLFLVRSLERLPSLKPKRDLTLGGVPKVSPSFSCLTNDPPPSSFSLQRTFVPTIPPRRIKKEPVDTPPPPPPSAGPKTKPGADRGRGKGKERRRGKEVVTTSSVFSMGPSERSMERKRGGAVCGEDGLLSNELYLCVWLQRVWVPGEEEEEGREEGGGYDQRKRG